MNFDAVAAKGTAFIIGLVIGMLMLIGVGGLWLLCLRICRAIGEAVARR